LIHGDAGLLLGFMQCICPARAFYGGLVLSVGGAAGYPAKNRIATCAVASIAQHLPLWEMLVSLLPAAPVWRGLWDLSTGPRLRACWPRVRAEMLG